MNTLSRVVTLAAIIAAMTGIEAAAAELRVGAGQTYASVTDAITAAASGDTIIIMDSATYAGSWVLTKQLNIRANPGATPTIQHSTNPMINFQPGSEGSQIGQIGGGRITFDGRFLSTRFVFFGQTGTTTTTLENLLVHQGDMFGTYYGVFFTNGTAGGAYAQGPVLMREVEMNMGGGGTGLRTDGLLGGRLTLERCTLRDAIYLWYTGAVVGGGGDVIFRQCHLRTGVGTAAAIYIAGPSGAYHTTIEYSIVEVVNSPASDAIRYDLPAATLTIRHSAIRGGNGAITMADNGNAKLRVDHSDLYGGGNDYFRFGPSGGREVLITNTNLFAANGAAISGGNDSMIFRFCNDYSTAGQYDTVPTVENCIQPGQNPQYVNAAGGDYTLGNIFLRRAGEAGTPIGSHQNPLLGEIDLPNAALWWTLFE